MEFQANHHPQPQPQPQPQPLLHDHRPNSTPMPPRRPKIKSVRKTTAPAKPYWKRPEPPMPRFFRVHPSNFRSLVHQLTGAPTEDAVPRPPPAHEIFLPPATMPLPPPLIVNCNALHYTGGGPIDYQAGNMLNTSTGDGGEAARILTPSLDAANYSAWCAPPILSPGTMAAIEYGSFYINY